MKSLNPLTLMSCLLLALSAVACRSGETPGLLNQDLHKTTSQEMALAQSVYTDTYTVLEEALLTMDDDSTSHLCATIAHDSLAQTLTIDFGTGCIGPQGRERSGLISVKYIGLDRQPGSEFQLTFDNYMLDDYGLEGSLLVKNLYRDSDSLLSFGLEIIDGQVSLANGDFVSYSSSHTFTWLEGEGLGDPLAMVFEITGESEGADSDGKSFDSEIVSPLRIQTACAQASLAYPVAGTIELNVATFPGTFSIDYGNGDCDRLATLTYSNVSIPLPLMN